MDNAGHSKTILISWTDYADEDPCAAMVEKVGTMDADFDYECLNELAKLLTEFEKV